MCVLACVYVVWGGGRRKGVMSVLSTLTMVCWIVADIVRHFLTMHAAPVVTLTTVELITVYSVRTQLVVLYFKRWLWILCV